MSNDFASGVAGLLGSAGAAGALGPYSIPAAIGGSLIGGFLSDKEKKKREEEAARLRQQMMVANARRDELQKRAWQADQRRLNELDNLYGKSRDSALDRLERGMQIQKDQSQQLRDFDQSRNRSERDLLTRRFKDNQSILDPLFNREREIREGFTDRLAGSAAKEEGLAAKALEDLQAIRNKKLPPGYNQAITGFESQHDKLDNELRRQQVLRGKSGITGSRLAAALQRARDRGRLASELRGDWFADKNELIRQNENRYLNLTDSALGKREDELEQKLFGIGGDQERLQSNFDVLSSIQDAYRNRRNNLNRDQIEGDAVSALRELEERGRISDEYLGNLHSLINDRQSATDRRLGDEADRHDTLSRRFSEMAKDAQARSDSAAYQRDRYYLDTLERILSPRKKEEKGKS